MKTIIPFRKIINYFSQHGLIQTARYSWFRIYEGYHRRRLGIRTFYKIESTKLGISDPLCHDHVSALYSPFKKSIKKITLNPGKDVFVDFGSGMGAALRMAAQYPFKKIIGVEISSKLTEIARELLEREKGKLVCKNIALIVTNAADYTLPGDATVLFFNNPFSGAVLAGVLENVRHSLTENPRKITIIVKAPQHFEEIPDTRNWLRRVDRFKSYFGSPYSIYESF